MTALHFDAFHALLDNYSRELPRILERHMLTQKLVSRVTDGLVLNESPFTVAVVGQMRVGKSSLLNTLVGADLAVTGVNETTATINWFKYASEDKRDR
ncbi:MAG: dynamin family protein, partial [Thermoguttaceae bacterium]